MKWWSAPWGEREEGWTDASYELMMYVFVSCLLNICCYICFWQCLMTYRGGGSRIFAYGTCRVHTQNQTGSHLSRTVSRVSPSLQNCYKLLQTVIHYLKTFTHCRAYSIRICLLTRLCPPSVRKVPLHLTEFCSACFRPHHALPRLPRQIHFFGCFELWPSQCRF